MGFLRKLFSLDAEDRRLLCRAAFLLIRSRLLLLVVPLPAVRWLVRRRVAPPRVPVRARIAWAIDAVGSRLGPAGTCLVRALAAEALLARHGYPAEIRLGVDRRDGVLQAHAWVVSDGCVLVGGSEAGAFQELEPVGRRSP
jgi:hypothetical protein